jgi:hypothetical protein
MNHSAIIIRHPASCRTPRTFKMLALPLLFVALLLGGCASGSDPLPGFRLGGWSPLATSRLEPQGPRQISLPRDAAALGATTLEVTLRNVVELSEQKRYAEARYLLAEVRATQPPDSEGFRAATCAMAIAALKEGDAGTFRRAARQLDTALGRPVRVDPAYVEVITLYRALNGLDLPVNAPSQMRALGRRLGEARSASVQTKG